MKFGYEHEEAVSPVIGVILMVAITVILAAVIAAFVFGMTDNMSAPKVVAATATQQGSDKIIVTYMGGADDQDVLWLNITAPNGTGYWTTEESGKIILTNKTGAPAKPSVGSSLLLTNGTGESWTGKNHVVVTAHFSDGAAQVILDTFV